MGKWIIHLLLFFIPYMGTGQQLPDSLLRKLDTAKTFESEAAIFLQNTNIVKSTPGEQITMLLPLLSYFTNKKNSRGIGYTELYISSAFSSYGDLSATVKHGIEALKHFEELTDTAGILSAYTYISNGFNGSKNTEQALTYWKKGIAIAKNFSTRSYSTFLNNMADGFNSIKKSDSALPYIREAVSIDRKLKEPVSLAASIGTLGETYIGLKEYDTAKDFIKESIIISKSIGENQSLDYGYNDMARIYFETSQFDSSLVYAFKGLSYAYPDYLIDAIRSYELIYKNFDKKNEPDSSNKYYRLAMEVKDSILSDEKNKEIQSMNFEEDIRQQEIQAAKEELEKQHKENIENILIAFGIIFFVIFFLLLSHSFIVHANIIKFLGIAALLLLFEFINLLLHPFLETFTHHSQVLTLLLLACLAALLIPLHHKIEHWAIHKMVEKNKSLRLAITKNVIEKKEDNENDLNEEA